MLTVNANATEISEMINAEVPTRRWTTYVTSLQRDGENTRVMPSPLRRSSQSNDNDSPDQDTKPMLDAMDSSSTATRHIDEIERQ
jgi:hypothetical protein